MDDELDLTGGREGLRAWLAVNAATASGHWLVRYRKGQPGYIPMRDITEDLLCFGWIDSAVRKRDALSSWLRISPRNPDSAWSGLNKRLVAKARASRRMTPAGEALIRAAKANGMWSFLDDVEALVVPGDLADAMGIGTEARRNWDAFPPSSRRGILEWIKQAKREDTRARRVAETARLAARNIRALSPEARAAR